jgi:hypothetical protein
MRSLLFAVSDSLAVADVALFLQRLLADSELLGYVFVVLLAVALATRAAAELCAREEVSK